MKKGNERGAVIIEGVLSLTTFMFAIFTLLSIVNICYIQARMITALSSAAKEISQYSYFYYKFGLDGLDASMAEGTEDSRELADGTIEGVATLMDSLGDASNSFQTGDFENMVGQIQSGVDNVDGLVNQYADRLAEDPKGFILGMGKMMGNEFKEKAKAEILCQVIAKAFMKKNLKATPDDDPDQFLKRYKVVGGMSGLDFEYSTFLQNGTSNLIQLVVTYKVKVLDFLNIDYEFTFRHCIKTTAWGRGVS